VIDPRVYGTLELGYGEAVVDVAEVARNGYRGRPVRIASVRGDGSCTRFLIEFVEFCPRGA